MPATPSGGKRPTNGNQQPFQTHVSKSKDNPIRLTQLTRSFTQPPGPTNPAHKPEPEPAYKHKPNLAPKPIASLSPNLRLPNPIPFIPFNPSYSILSQPRSQTQAQPSSPFHPIPSIPFHPKPSSPVPSYPLPFHPIHSNQSLLSLRSLPISNRKRKSDKLLIQPFESNRKNNLTHLNDSPQEEPGREIKTQTRQPIFGEERDLRDDPMPSQGQWQEQGLGLGLGPRK